MSINTEIEELQRRLDELAQVPDDELLERYSMKRPVRPRGLYWQFRWLAGRILRWFESKGIPHADPWPASLKHGKSNRNAKPLLIWAVGADRRTLREACGGLIRLMKSEPGLAPVLVTDVADFAFYSRLSWLVEYLPSLDGIGELAENRKQRYLARLYHGVPALPVQIGLASGAEAAAVRKWIARII